MLETVKTAFRLYYIVDEFCKNLDGVMSGGDRLPSKLRRHAKWLILCPTVRKYTKGKKKGCHHDNQSSLLTLKSNTMKNTTQI
jgi:hypothetical protein